MTHNALVTRLGLEIGISSQEVSDFRLDGLREQGPCPVAQNLSERIAEGPWLSQLDDVSVGYGVSLLWWRSGGVEHPHDTPPYPFMPSPTSAHSSVDLLIIQIDGLHIGNDLVLVTALGIDGNGDRHPLGLVERATENTAVVQALIDNLIERGLDRRSVGCSSSMAPRR